MTSKYDSPWGYLYRNLSAFLALKGVERKLQRRYLGSPNGRIWEKPTCILPEASLWSPHKSSRHIPQHQFHWGPSTGPGNKGVINSNYDGAENREKIVPLEIHGYVSLWKLSFSKYLSKSKILFKIVVWGIKGAKMGHIRGTKRSKTKQKVIKMWRKNPQRLSFRFQVFGLWKLTIFWRISLPRDWNRKDNRENVWNPPEGNREFTWDQDLLQSSPSHYPHSPHA